MVGGVQRDEAADAPDEQLSGYDINDVAAWLDTSVLSNPQNDAPDVPPDSPFDSMANREDELEALKALHRVHFVQKVPETRPLQDTVKTYSDISLDAQIYVRKVVNRFPSLPPGQALCECQREKG